MALLGVLVATRLRGISMHNVRKELIWELVGRQPYKKIRSTIKSM